jgi:hypothetical protein
MSPTTAAPLAPLPLHEGNAPPDSVAVTLGIGMSIEDFQAPRQLELLRQIAFRYSIAVERIKITGLRAASVQIDLLLLPSHASDPFSPMSSTVAERLAADVASSSYGFKFGTIPGLFAKRHCDASKLPLFGQSGNCKRLLRDGDTCLPTCNQGYAISAPTMCRSGELQPGFCEPSGCDVNSAQPRHGSAGDCVGVLRDLGSCQPTCDPGYRVSGRTTCRAGVLHAATCERPLDTCKEGRPPDCDRLGSCAECCGGNSTESCWDPSRASPNLPAVIRVSPLRR